MNTGKKVPHSANEGYPYACIESRELLKSRVSVVLQENGSLKLDLNEFTEPDEDEASRSAFLISRIFDYQEALKIAEEQIEEILDDKDPFIPEDLLFELVHQPDTIHDSPIRLYSSTTDDRFSMYRNIVDVDGDDLDSTMWTIIKKHATGSDVFDKIEVSIPCMRIGFIVLYALGVSFEKK